MAETNSDLTKGLQQAIQSEIDGYHFYMMAARSTEDEQGKEIFQQLAREEAEHVKFLRLQYQSIMQSGKPDADIKLGKAARLGGPSPIFSNAIQGRIKDAHFEMSALSIGIQLELSAQKFYRRQSQVASDPLVKQFFNELVEWESTHYHTLLTQLETLKEDYWSEGGFSPF